MRSTPLSQGIGLVLVGLLATSLGCTETPPPVVPAVPTAPAVAPPPPAPAVDLTPVAEPADIIAVARWKNPNATLAGVSSCSGVPAPLLETNARRLLDKALASAFRGGVDGRQLADAIALDAPVDLVVALDAGRRGQPDALFAFSIGLTSLDRAKSTLEAAGPLVELQPGLWRVGAKDASDLDCVVGPAAGAAPARLICAAHDKALNALAPYLARNVPLAAPPAQDVHAEFRFTPIDARYGSTLRQGLVMLPGLARMQSIGEPHFDHALEVAAAALSDEGAALVGDLDHVSLDVGLDGSSCLKASAALQLRGKSSWLAGTIAERGDHAGPPPALFWRAPIDSDSASFGHATDAARYSGIFRTLRGLLEGKLAKDKIGSEADRKALAGLLAAPLGKDTNVVVASGHVAAPSKALATGTRPSGQQIADELSNSYLGWYLLGFDEGPATLTKLLKDAVGVYGRKGLSDPLHKALGRQADILPTAKLVAAPAPLGKGALDIEIRFEGGGHHEGGADAKNTNKKKPAAEVSVVLHLLLMSDGKSTWIAMGANRDELVRRLLATRSGAPDAGTLATRPGLEPLRSGKAFSSGFVTLAMFTRPVAGMLGNPLFTSAAGAAGPVLADVANALNNLPHKGDTPIFLTSTATGTGPRTEFVINMEKGSFEDVGTILMTAHRSATTAGLLHP